MLILSRRVKGTIIIQHQGVEIKVKVTGVEEVNGEIKVNLGFEAPKSVTIDRSEVVDKRSMRLKKLFNDQ